MMPLYKRAAMVAAAAVGLFCFPADAIEIPAVDMAPEPDALGPLVARLDRWIDAHTDLPGASTPAAIRFAGPGQFTPETGDAPKVGRHVRGLYTPETATITLLTPWSPDSVQDVSVLLHELVHHRQAWSGRGLCRAARERDAYGLQRGWLEARGAKLDVNRFAISFHAGCTLHNVHPD